MDSVRRDYREGNAECHDAGRHYFPAAGGPCMVCGGEVNLDDLCPRCGAGPGEPCRAHDGREVRHIDRP